jgi:hypothetical protein
MGMRYIGQSLPVCLVHVFMLYLSPIGDAAAYVFNLRVDLIFLPLYYFSVAVLLPAFFDKSANFMRRQMVVSSV